MTDFVRPGSIVRRIWGDADMVLLIFTGSAAEFALNREVDWLFFTGKLPADPVGRLISTASHARQIVFADELTATRTFERIRAAHAGVERQRGQRIPDWAHCDVLYMLIDYSERAHELLVGPLNAEAKDDLYGYVRTTGPHGTAGVGGHVYAPPRNRHAFHASARPRRSRLIPRARCITGRCCCRTRIRR